MIAGVGDRLWLIIISKMNFLRANHFILPILSLCISMPTEVANSGTQTKLGIVLYSLR
jgi:hypothetical protein